LDRALALVGGVWLINLVNFMDGIDWMTVAEIVPWLCSAWRARFCIRNFGCSRALRRDDRFRAVQPARCQIISRQCRQFADRAVVGLAAGDVGGQRPSCGRNIIPLFIWRMRPSHWCADS
jgi:hypothetical protein